MDAAKIKALKLADPFRPFYLVLKDGQRIFIDQSHHIGIAPDGSRLGISYNGKVSLLPPESVQDVDICPAQLKS